MSITASIRVNDILISNDAIRAEALRLQDQFQQVRMQRGLGEEIDAELLHYAQENLIEKTLIEAEVRRFAIEVDDSRVAEAVKQICGHDPAVNHRKVLSQVRAQMELETLMALMTEEVEEPSLVEVRGYYDAHPQQFMAPSQVRAAHIVAYYASAVEQEKASGRIHEIKNKLIAGGSFEALANTCSDEPGNSGSLGIVEPNQLGPEYDEVLFSLKAGQVSDVFQSAQGFHLVKVYDIYGGSAQDFTAVQDEIHAGICNNRKHEVFSRFVDELRQQATVETIIDDEVT